MIDGCQRPVRVTLADIIVSTLGFSVSSSKDGVVTLRATNSSWAGMIGHDDKRILKIQASRTAHWHDKGADWRGLAHTPAHHRSRLSDSVKNGNAFRTVHNAALPAR